MDRIRQVLEEKKISTPLIYGIAIIFGIFSGLSDASLLHAAGTTISEIFIRIFKFISLPIIALSIIVALSQFTTDSSLHTVWKRTLKYTLGTTIIAASVACALYLLISPENVCTTYHKTANNIPAEINHNYATYLINLIPSNLITPFMEHQVISVILISMLAGIAIRHIKEKPAQKAVKDFFKGLHGVFLVITNWIVAVVPIAIFGFITTTILELKNGMDFKGIGQYLAIIVLANLAQGLVILPLWLKSNGINPIQAMKGMAPALSLAFFSKSSAGALPFTMDNAEKNLKVHPKIARFVLPLCTTINMNGCAAFIFTTVMYLMQNNGIDITLSTMALWVLVSTIAAVGNAGVPMGCFFLSASLLASMNVPIALLGLILPFYAIIDMLETSLNVWSDSCVATVVNKKTPTAETNKQTNNITYFPSKTNSKSSSISKEIGT